MAEEILIFDKAGSLPDGTDPGSPLSIGPGTSYQLVDAQFPAPPLNVLYSSSIDTEGENAIQNRHGNRTINLTIGVDESGAVNTLVDALAGKFAKLQREGGTLHRTRKDGSVRIYDILAGDGWQVPYNDQYLLAHSADVPFTLPAKPYARGVEVDLGNQFETTNPCIVFTETGIAGDVPALGRLVVGDNQVQSQGWLVWGIQSRNYSSAATAALFYEAEGRTAMGGSAIATGPAGASGGGSNNVLQHTALATMYQAIMSTQTVSAGAHLSHIGTFRVFARFQTPTANTGTVSVALEWGEGDFRRWTRNTPVTFGSSVEGTWQLANLGLVSPAKTTTGTQRWEGRIIAKSTASGDDINIDWIMLVPADEGYGEASSVVRVDTPTTFAARDEFDQTAGNLGGKTLPVGGTWTTSASGTAVADFAVSGTGTVSRTAAAFTAGARIARAGATSWTDVVATADTWVTSADIFTNDILATRYLDASNYLAMFIPAGLNTSAGVYKRVAGVNTVLYAPSGPNIARVLSQVTNFKMYVNALGRWAAYINGALVAEGFDSVLATGGALASGGVALIQDASGAGGGTPTVVWDNLAVWVPPADAAVFSLQTLEVRHDRVVREDSSGTIWQPPSKYSGDYLRVPPAMAEARTLRTIVKMSRNVPGDGPDTGTDDMSANLFVTPRYL